MSVCKQHISDSKQPTSPKLKPMETTAAKRRNVNIKPNQVQSQTPFTRENMTLIAHAHLPIKKKKTGDAGLMCFLCVFLTLAASTFIFIIGFEVYEYYKGGKSNKTMSLRGRGYRPFPFMPMARMMWDAYGDYNGMGGYGAAYGANENNNLNGADIAEEEKRKKK